MKELLKSPANLLTLVKQINTLLNRRYALQRILHCLVDILQHKLASRYTAIILADTGTEHLKIKIAQGLSQSFMNRYQRITGTGITGKMLLGGENIIINNIDASSEEYNDLKLEDDFTSVIAARIAAHGKTYGFLISQRSESDAFLAEDMLLLEIAAQAASIALYQNQLVEENKELTVIDKESGTYKFHFFCERLIQEIERAKSYNESISVLLIDIDNFKDFNRLYGYEAACSLLSKLVTVIRQHCVGLDIIGRYGQDKIMVSLINKNEEQAAEVAERIKEDMYQFDFYRPHNPVSIGVYTCSYEDVNDINRVADCLGITLFHAHYHNGNQVCRWSTCMYGFPQ
ncbi:MAG: diguanylate cyclase [Candidatus Auribacterota bacterium]|jgi:diguanylate cyclase (GGDEF)-like protein|nr:diguanylate cyclase [Candidatus Auribacterota bacterium]